MLNELNIETCIQVIEYFCRLVFKICMKSRVAYKLHILIMQFK